MGKNREVGKIKIEIAEQGRAGDHVTEEFFCLLSKQSQRHDKILEAQLFLVRLLVPLALASQPRFCLMLVTSALGLTLGLAIGGAESIGREVAVGFSRWS